MKAKLRRWTTIFAAIAAYGYAAYSAYLAFTVGPREHILWLAAALTLWRFGQELREKA